MYPRSMVDSDCVVIQGSNMAECHPVAFRWPMQAKLKGTKLIHVNLRFTRTSAVAVHGPGGYLIGVPALANQQQQYLQWQLTAFAQGLRKNNINAPMRFIASQP